MVRSLISWILPLHGQTLQKATEGLHPAVTEKDKVRSEGTGCADPDAKAKQPKTSQKKSKDRSSGDSGPAKIMSAVRHTNEDRKTLTEKNTVLVAAFPREVLPRTARMLDALKKYLCSSVAREGITLLSASANSYLAVEYTDTEARDKGLKELQGQTISYEGTNYPLQVAKFGEKRSPPERPSVWLVPTPGPVTGMTLATRLYCALLLLNHFPMTTTQGLASKPCWNMGFPPTREP